MFIYGVIPALILAFWYATIKALTQRSPETVADFIFLIVTLFVLPIGYGYFLYRLKKPDIDRKKNYNDLIERLCNFAHSDNYICIGVEFNRGTSNNYTGLYYYLSHGGQWYYFNQNGFANLNQEQILGVLRTLERRLDGYLKIYYEDYAVYCPSATITHGTMPGGSDGYYVNTSSYETGRTETYAYLYLGETAKKRRLEDKNKKSKKNGLKEI